MSWFNRSLKGQHTVGTDNPDANAAGPSSRHGLFSSGSPKGSKKPQSSFQDTEEYAPPPGPPPSHHFEPPPGPPPSHGFEPPPGPPPSHEFEAPPGPPPTHRSPAAPPAYPKDPTQPYHDWTAVPDTALLPPPPSLGHEASNTSNASEMEAIRAKEWCRRNPMMGSRSLPPDAQSKRSSQNHLKTPREFKGNVSKVSRNATKIRSSPDSSDSCLWSEWPLYARSVECPLDTERRRTIYFEVQILSIGRAGRESASFSLGYFAAPYPTWRQTGWERGSLGVHSDDGRRYVNDSYGGKDFTDAFNAGERVGIGMTFSVAEVSPEDNAQGATAPRMAAEVFFTRDGKKVGTWNLHEERDAKEDLGVEGLEGEYDLYAATGIYGAVELDVFLDERDWMFYPDS